MKTTFILIALTFLTACKMTQSIVPTFVANPVVAHRGAFKTMGFPENSIAGLRRAIELGCTGSEFDVHLTADDVLVINHDPHFFKKDIETNTYAELSKNRLPNGEMLPTLKDYLLEGMKANKKTRLVLEIKPSSVSKERGRVVAERVFKMVTDLKATPFVVYISFDYDILKKILELNPKADCQYLNGDKTPEAVKADGMTGIDYHHSVFKKNPEWIELAKKNGIALNAWTVNDTTTMRFLLKNGFEFITTNEPERLFDLLKK